MAKKKKQLPDLSKHDVLTPIDVSQLGGIKKYIRGLIRKGKDRKEVITKTVEKFEVPRKRIRELYKECIK